MLEEHLGQTLNPDWYSVSRCGYITVSISALFAVLYHYFFYLCNRHHVWNASAKLQHIHTLKALSETGQLAWHLKGLTLEVLWGLWSLTWSKAFRVLLISTLMLEMGFHWWSWWLDRLDNWQCKWALTVKIRLAEVFSIYNAWIQGNKTLQSVT